MIAIQIFSKSKINIRRQTKKKKIKAKMCRLKAYCLKAKEKTPDFMYLCIFYLSYQIILEGLMAVAIFGQH